MNSLNGAVARRFLIALGIMLAMAAVMLGIAISPTAFAEDGDPTAAEEPAPDDSGLVATEDPSPGDGTKPFRTIMIYLDGASSEENNPVCSAMLKEYMASKFDRSDFRIIVMTGGSLKWHLDASYLRDKNGNAGTLTEISSEYNQIWEVYGATDDAEGYLRLLDGDGVSGDEANAKTSAEELMSDPDTLQQFINYAYSVAPAGKYDLVLNDHGSGPGRGYGYDDHDTESPDVGLSLLELRQAISGSEVVQDVGKFDFINFDCCLLGNFETALALEDYTDYFLGSADVDPMPTVDYTAVFDFLATDPDMDAWVLGCKLVDLFVDYYDENTSAISIGPSETYCVVNTDKLKQSGIVDKLFAIARQMRTEATAGSFYDEIRVPKDSYRFGYANIQDFATVMEQLGIGLYESDWEEPGFLNAYTQSALEIQNILHDEDVVYSRHTQRSNKTHAFFGRDDDGSITARATKSPTSGLSIFSFANPSNGDVSYEVAFYAEAMKELSGAYGEGSTEKELFETYMQAILDYELICNAGVAVSNLVEDGCDPNEIDYDKVHAYLQSQKSGESKRGWEYISKAFDASDRDVEAWLGGIIEIQREEVLNHDKVSLKTESHDGTDYYRLDVADTPKRVIDVPVLTVTANKEDDVFNKPTRTFYGTRMTSDGEESAGDYMSATDSSYQIPKFDGQWYAVQDADGGVYLASDASDHSVYANFYSMDGKSMGAGELLFDADGNADSIYLYGNTIPISLDTFEEMVTVALCNDPSYGGDTVLGSFVLEGKNAKLVKDSCSNLGIDDVELTLAISDMYDARHEVKPELTFDPAGGQWEDGTSAIKKYETALESSFDIIDAPTREGYTFVCWQGSEYQPGENYLADSDHTFTALWEKNPESDPATTEPEHSDDANNQDPDNQGETARGKSSIIPSLGDLLNLMYLLLVSAALGGAIAVAAKNRKRN
ncbi:clostripain-related cysteine peptidase [Denitrobacterium detoxificans]|jgi:uncharacterized repeat protein (TIGR02543 family)|uniref:clostripain-related cysteine peptidase n=1 Tax=Denitrobacterium detoxificans TaxID=79604 RepID=UPI0026EABCEB|nr:clostripain-related cysteine peptidase [Denitrobacterium detoxificans]MBE6466120.1 hypothetical protein [Denitrobacterium detoxificans]